VAVVRKIFWIGWSMASGISLAGAGGVGGVAGGVAAGVGGVAAGVGGVAGGVGGVSAGVAGVGVGATTGVAPGFGGKAGLGIGAATSGRVSNKFRIGDQSRCVVRGETSNHRIQHCQNFVLQYGTTLRAQTRYRTVNRRRLQEAAAHPVSPPIRPIAPRSTTNDYSLASFKEFLAQHGGANRSEKEIEELYVQFKEWNRRPRK
jgi:hypothetical protein